MEDVMSEPTEWQFWWTWAAHAGTAIGTIAAVVVALFGGWLKARLAAPKLEIDLKDRKGMYVPTLLKPEGADGPTIDTFSRWYHVRVENKRRWSPATDVRLLLLRLEQRDAAGQYQTTWVGEIPLQWSNPQITPLAPTVGPAYDCDLCSVLRQPSRQHTLSLHPIIQPFNLPTHWQTPIQVALTLQARSLDTDSHLFRVEIAWDGQWADDADQMAKHLVVRPAPDLTLPIS
jgi:hypothetical protein